MIQVIRSAERYHFENEWLATHWHFSFDHYHDPANVSFGPLRVFNEDTIAPGGGFPFHPHREMEIITYMIEGQLEHRDTLGNRGVINTGEVQRMSAGTGIRHSESNPSGEKRAHLVQLWILPKVAQLPPSWEQKRYPQEERSGKLLPIAVPANGKHPQHAVEIHQDATIYTSRLGADQSVKHRFAPGRRGYVFVIDGELSVNGQRLKAGDQARISGEPNLEFSGPAGSSGASADFLFLDLPMR
jgi:hypothetical protein